MPRGRPPNLARDEAKLDGRKTFTADVPCIICATQERYTSNGNCVECTKAKASARYHHLTPEQLAEWKRRDRQRHLAYAAARARSR